MSTRGTASEAKDWERWPTRSVEITDRVLEAIKSYRPPTGSNRPSTGSSNLMHAWMHRLALGALLLLILAGGAGADSDGYFCIADGYLAYELREWSTADQKHALHIVFVGRPEGSVAAVVPLDAFQLHGMRCEPRGIVILGWDKRYTIAFSEQEPPKLTATEPFKEARTPREFRAEGLSLVRQSRSVAIPSARPDRSYQLQIDYRRVDQASSKDGAIHHLVTATLVEKDATGIVLNERQIYQSDSKETVD